MLPAEPVLLGSHSRSEALCICLLDLWLVCKHFPSSNSFETTIPKTPLVFFFKLEQIAHQVASERF